MRLKHPALRRMGLKYSAALVLSFSSLPLSCKEHGRLARGLADAGRWVALKALRVCFSTCRC